MNALNKSFLYLGINFSIWYIFNFTYNNMRQFKWQCNIDNHLVALKFTAIKHLFCLSIKIQSSCYMDCNNLAKVPTAERYVLVICFVTLLSFDDIWLCIYIFTENIIHSFIPLKLFHFLVLLKFDFFGKMKCDEESEYRHKEFKESKKERDLFGASKPHRSFKVSALNTRLLLMKFNELRLQLGFGKSTTLNLWM